MEMTKRFIGIRHRVKRTKEGEAKPTQVTILENSRTETYDLATETDELDWLKGQYPVKFRPVNPDEDLSKFKSHQIKWRQLKKEENPQDFSQNLLRQEGKEYSVAIKVPAEYDGLQAGDLIGMILGGSGDRFAAALSRRGQDIEAKVMRVAPFTLKDWRGPIPKEDDASTLASLVKNHPELFYEVKLRDRQNIRLANALDARQEALRQKVACEQRIFSNLVGRIFLSEDGHFSDGQIEEIYKSEKANDRILQSLESELKDCDKDLEKSVKALDVWDIFKEVDGVGPRIAAGILVSISDPRRFMVQPDFTNANTEEEWRHCVRKAREKTVNKIKAYLGAHVKQGGQYEDTPTEKQFPRKHAGEIANWDNDGRQALYLLADQCVRRKESDWGKKLIHYKQNLRNKHPQEETIVDLTTGKPKLNKNGKPIKRYSDGHIHKMAYWRTITRFVEWFAGKWLKMWV